MKKNPPSLTGYDMFSIQVLFFGASAGFIYPSMIVRSTTGAYWVPLVVWAAVALLSCLLYSKLLGRLQEGKLIDRLCQSAGIPAALIICLPQLIFIFGALVVMLRAYSELITMTMLPTTPITFLNGMLLAPGALALAGMMPIARAARVLYLISTLLSVCLMLIGFSDVKWTLGGPWLFTNGDFLMIRNFYSGSFIWMGFVFTALIGSYNPRISGRYRKSYIYALLLSFPMIAGFIYLPVMTFGRELTRHLTLPYISKMDSVYHYWVVFENLTALFVSVTMLYVLLVMALKLHALGESVKSLFPRANPIWIYGIVVLLVYASASALPSWRAVEGTIFYTLGLRLYALFGFPLLGLALLSVRERKRKVAS